MQVLKPGDSITDSITVSFTNEEYNTAVFFQGAGHADNINNGAFC